MRVAMILTGTHSVAEISGDALSRVTREAAVVP